jgi:hypothetical protein
LFSFQKDLESRKKTIFFPFSRIFIHLHKTSPEIYGGSLVISYLLWLSPRLPTWSEGSGFKPRAILQQPNNLTILLLSSLSALDRIGAANTVDSLLTKSDKLHKNAEKIILKLINYCREAC